MTGPVGVGAADEVDDVVEDGTAEEVAMLVLDTADEDVDVLAEDEAVDEAGMLVLDTAGDDVDVLVDDAAVDEAGMLVLDTAGADVLAGDVELIAVVVLTETVVLAGAVVLAKDVVLVNVVDTVFWLLGELAVLEVFRAGPVVVVTGVDVERALLAGGSTEGASEADGAAEVDEVLAAGPYLYSSSLTPAPQYSVLSPGQRKLQSSWLSALTLPA